MPPKSQLSPKGQIGLVLGVSLFFSVALAIGGYMGSHQTSAKMAAFASDGVTVTGTITRKYIHVVTKVWVYWLDVRFKSLDGIVHNESTNVVNTLFDSLDEGGPVAITYVKSNPQWFYVGEVAPTERDVGISNAMFEVGIFGICLCLAGFFCLLMWNRENGTSSVRALPHAARPKALLQNESRAPRATFGVHRG